MTHAYNSKMVKITGGTFCGNKADYGGFLYTEGGGTASCKEGSAKNNSAVDGGGVYAVDNATVEWECDLFSNSAMSGPGM